MIKSYVALFLCIILCFLFSSCFITQNSENSESTYNIPNVTQYTQQDAEITLTTSITMESTANENEISRFSTILYNKEENRVHNIKTAAKKLNHTVIEPGEIFSFNKTIGERTQARGYKKASILVDGEKKTGTGGGICQISSTIYNAALDADMKVIERHKHSKEVPYVPVGKDAAVVYGAKDFSFKNTKDYPVEILITVTEDEVQIILNKKT